MGNEQSTEALIASLSALLEQYRDGRIGLRDRLKEELLVAAPRLLRELRECREALSEIVLQHKLYGAGDVPLSTLRSAIREAETALEGGSREE